jgi:hypothetical protein
LIVNVILAIFAVGFGPAVYDFRRARTTTTASTLNLHALEETVATTSQPAQATRCKGLREEQAERGYFAALERIERRPKYKKKSGEPDEFDEEQADVVAVATPQEARPLVTAHASKDGALQEVCIGDKCDAHMFAYYRRWLRPAWTTQDDSTTACEQERLRLLQL